MKKKYDLYVSLGAACSCTSTLRQSQLQFYSYPYDWVSGLNFFDRVKFLTNDFENWFNKEDLLFVKSSPAPFLKDIYINTKTNMTFNHDFPIHSDFDKTYPKVKEKYDRRIKRLLSQIKNANRVLFVYIELPNITKEIPDDSMTESLNLLKSKFPNVDINILYLFNSPNISFKDREILNISEGITKIKFDYNKYQKDAEQEVSLDKLCKIFKKYKITNKYLTLKNKADIFRSKISNISKRIFSVQNHYSKTGKTKKFILLGFEIIFPERKI